MKKMFWFAVILTSVFFLPGFAAASDDSYSRNENWTLLEDGSASADFDVFYVYPTMFSGKENPYMDWLSTPELRAKTVAWTKAQTSIFKGDARIFAPFVRQLGLRQSLPLLHKRWCETDLRPGIDDTAAAFAYYDANYRNGRPFVLFGHSQGAVDLYELLKHNPEITEENGFVAAYLIGLPRLTREQLASDFSGRSIRPAAGASDTGVIIIWNTQSPTAETSPFSGPGTCGINPLNWRTDATAAEASENAGSFFYDWKTNRTHSVKNLCGARFDPEKGALIVELPDNSQYNGGGSLGNGVFHVLDVWLFAENLRLNCRERVRNWKMTRDKKPAAATGATQENPPESRQSGLIFTQQAVW